MMGGTSPYNVGSPSFHSSSYLPKMEANFWNNLRCCNTNFIDLHELLQHFEQIHSQEPSTFPYRMSLPGTGKIPRRKNSTIDVAPDRPSNQVRGFQPQSNANAQPHPLREGRVPGQNEQNNMPLTSHVHDMDTMGDMEMDDENPIHDSQNMNPSSNSRPTSINPSLANMLQNQAGFPSSNPTTPRASQALQRTNPMVSSVNTPTLTHNSSAFSTDTGLLDGTLDQDPFSSTQFPNNDMLLSSHMLQNLQTDFGSLDFNDNMNMNGNGMLDLCINDPAKALFSENGGINSTQYPQFGFINGAATNTDNPSAHKLTTPNLASGIPRGQLPGEEDRPFKCPVIGCEKAYKNANGLRYHEKVSLSALPLNPANLPNAARALVAKAQRQLRRDLLHRRPRDIHPIPRHRRYGEGETIPLRALRQALQESQRPEIPPQPQPALQPGLQLQQRHTTGYGRRPAHPERRAGRHDW